MISRVSTSVALAELANAQKVMRDWRNLDPRFYPGAGTGRLTANQAFAIDFVTAFTKALHDWLKTDPDTFKQLYERDVGVRRAM